MIIIFLGAFGLWCVQEVLHFSALPWKMKLWSNFPWLSTTIKIYHCWCDLLEAKTHNFLSINPVMQDRTDNLFNVKYSKMLSFSLVAEAHGPDLPSPFGRKFPFCFVVRKSPNKNCEYQLSSLSTELCKATSVELSFSGEVAFPEPLMLHKKYTGTKWPKYWPESKVQLRISSQLCEPKNLLEKKRMLLGVGHTYYDTKWQMDLPGKQVPAEHY